MSRFRLIGIVLIAMVMALPAIGQTTSTLSGNATVDGIALPGVTVTITSPNMQGSRTTVTGDGGGYSFVGIPAGEYTVRFELEGMQTVSKVARIGVGQSGRADASMQPAAISEAITVTAAAPTVLETPTVSSNVNSQLVEELPVGRTVMAAALISPGVNDNTPSGNQLSISGSPGYDNLVMVNGVAITENVRHQSLSLFVEDAIQETTVMTGAISAEYGGFTGGVVNSITKSGGNEFSGSLRDSITNPSWREKTPRQKELGTELVDELGNSYEATLGGFILRDRLWFFTSGRKENLSDQVTQRTIPNSGGVSNSFARKTDETRYEIKLTGQLTPKHNLVGSYFELDRTIDQSVFTTVSYDAESISGRKDPQELMSGHYSGMITNNWLVEAQYSAMDWGVALGNGAKFTDFERGTIVRNRADSNARWNSPTFCGVCDEETRSNDGLKIKSHHFLSTKSLGNHDIVAGYETFAEHRHSNNYQSGSNFRMFVNGVNYNNGTIYPIVNPGPGGSAAFLVWTPIFDLQQGESDLGSDSIFINDRWDLNANWSFSIGARYDKNDAVDGSGTTVSDDSKITPRLNAIFDPAGDGRHRFTVSYAQYASRIVDGPATSGSSAGSPGYIYYAYQGPAINPAGTPIDQMVDTRTALSMIWDWFNNACDDQGNCGVDNLSLLRANSGHDVPGYSSRIVGELTSPYVEEYTIGYGTQWATNLVTRVDLISRDWKDFYASRIDGSTPQIDDFLGIGHDLAYVENTDSIKREYRGIQFQGAWNPRRFNVGLNYTWSTLKGNDEQESSTSGTVGNTPSEIYYPEISNYERRLPTGYLLQDQRHRARAWVGYDVPVPDMFGNLNLSVLQNYDSGLPYSASGTIDMEPYFDQYLSGTSYIAAPAGRGYYFSDRGEFRMSDVTSTDLAVNYSFPIRNVQIFATAEMLNVFNRAAVTTVNTAVTTAWNSSRFAAFDPFTDTPVECPQGTAAAECQAMGANWQKGANFGKPSTATSFQTPRMWRFQVGFRF